ncbi:MAG: hypothetical protein U0359_22815 [Byssovorax sp.]
MSEPEAPDPQRPDAPPEGEAVVITDTSREGEVVAEALRATGLTVAQIHPAELEARTLHDLPRALLVDVDQPGVLETVEHLLELSEGPPLAIFCLGDPTRAAELGVTRASGRAFARPVDVEALVAAVSKVAQPEARPRVRSTLPPELHRRPTLPPRSRESETPSPVSEMPSISDPFDAAALLADQDAPSLGGPALPTELSPELQQILDAAEQRMSDLGGPPSVSTAAGEADLILPAELLSLLDEPLDPEGEGGTSAGGTMGTPSPQGTSGSIAPSTGAGAPQVPRAASTESGRIGAPDLARPGTQPGRKTGQMPVVSTSRAGTSAGRITGVLAAVEPRIGTTPGRPLAAPEAPDPRSTTPVSFPGIFAESSPSLRQSPLTSPSAMEPALPIFAPAVLPPTQAPPAPPPEPARRPPVEHAELPADRPTPLPPRFSPTGELPRVPRAAPVVEIKTDLTPPVLLGEGDAVKAVARAVSSRVSGALSLGAEPTLRRIVLHEGDIVTAGSSAPDETLVAFLVARGDLPRGEAHRLSSKLPPFGRHAGAALIAQGHLGQDDLWPVLRAHAEWIIGRALLTDSGAAELLAEPPGRYKAEPGVFGGATGAEVLVEITRRVIAPETAIRRLGGPGARLAPGPYPALLSECALSREDEALVRAAPGQTVTEALAGHPPELADLLYALTTLGVLEALAPVEKPRPAHPGGVDPLDEEAVRQRVRARLALVEEGDYFSLLGVSRGATSYEIKRAYLDLRRSFEPGRLLTAQTADLGPDLRVILEVLEEAYDILRDAPRRERYRKAIEAGPP